MQIVVPLERCRAQLIQFVSGFSPFAAARERKLEGAALGGAVVVGTRCG